jgi:NitT/TauT family transport system permease protein
MDKLVRLALPVVGVAALLAVWHFYVVLFNVPTAVLPRPAAVLESLV